jgi:hypothetical protein
MLLRAREQALDHVLHMLCEPSGIVARLGPSGGRDAASQAAVERAMLTRVELSRRSLVELGEGTAIVYGVKVLGPVASIERLDADPIVRVVEPWMRTTIRGAERLVGPDPQMPTSPRAADQVEWIEALEPSEVRARLQQAISEPPECRAWLDRQEEIRREGARMRLLVPPDTPSSPPASPGVPGRPLPFRALVDQSGQAGIGFVTARLLEQ